MNYIYDIYLNFQKIPLDFFEWNKKDILTHLKKVPIFKINLSTFKNLYSYKIKIDKTFLDNIKYKTEVWKDKKNIKYCSLFCTNNSLLAIYFSDNGISYKKSILYVDEELEILENCLYNIKETKIKYEIIKKDKYILKTRKEKYEEIFIKKNLNNIDNEKLKYIFLECYGNIDTTKNMLYKLKSINYTHKNYKKLYNVLKLISTIKK